MKGGGVVCLFRKRFDEEQKKRGEDEQGFIKKLK